MFDDVCGDRVVAIAGYASIWNNQHRVDVKFVIEIERVHALAPEDAQAVVAVEAGEAREQCIVDSENLGGHERRDGVGGDERLVVLDGRGALGTRGIAAGIPRRKTDSICGLALEPLDHHAEAVLRVVFGIVAFAIQHHQAQVVLDLVAMGNRVHPHGVTVALHSRMTAEEFLPRRVNAIGGRDRNLQVAQILVGILGPNHHVVTDDCSRKLQRLVKIGLVGGTVPLEHGSRSPHGIAHLHAGRRQVVAKMQEHVLHRAHVVAVVIIAEQRNMQAVVQFQVIDNEFGQVDGVIERLLFGGVLVKAVRLVDLVVVDRLGGVVHHLVAHPQVHALEVALGHGVMEPHLVARGAAVGVGGAFAEDRDLGRLALKKVLNGRIVVGAREEKRRQGGEQIQIQKAHQRHI